MLDNVNLMNKKIVISNELSVVPFFYEESAYSGVKKIADKVRDDVYKVSGKHPEAIYELAKEHENIVLFMTVGKSEILDQMVENKKLDISTIKGKREVFGMFIVEQPTELMKQALVIVGSDKRGTIYGLFHISKLIGVSPLVNWSMVVPEKKTKLILTAKDEIVSKEPSVEYRGFFINDEWPCFGNWCMTRFGGVNAEMYDHVFEVLLRLKGNYLWPAMWASCFAKDGPGLKNAELADEYGVVMGLSHHEPCLRHGEEYSHVRGKDSIYGDAWNFRTNKEGITRFWEDGLKRNGHLENVITIGMRGERDSTIMGEEASLKDNIELLKDAIRTQNQLIKECVNEEIENVPRLLALYKEVEAFFYGDQETEGLKGWEELEDVILLLCDDNHGYLRTVPDEELRKHRGGYGMYYHFDYHGDPVSYEWTNSTYLPQVWEQMTVAYESGIQKLWVVNVGDLGLQEFPLSYFMELAYDYDTWGITAPNSTKEFTSQWMKLQFGSVFSKEKQEELSELMMKFSRINHSRRPEHLGDKIYHPVHFMESKKILQQVNEVMDTCQKFYEVVKGTELEASFYELLYYNIMASMNLHKLWIYTGWNHFLSKRGLLAANHCAKVVEDCMEFDESCRDSLHSQADGSFYGFGMASHIGFTHWNDEEARNPVLHKVLPRKKPYFVAGLATADGYTCGEEWTGKKLVLEDFKNPNINQTEIYVALGSESEISYQVRSDCDWIQFGEGEIAFSDTLSKKECFKLIPVTILRDKMKDLEIGDDSLHVANIEILVPETKGKICIEVLAAKNEDIRSYRVIQAVDFTKKMEPEMTRFQCLEKIGRDSDGMKLFPVLADFSQKSIEKEEIPYLEYEVELPKETNYILRFYMEPVNPLYMDETVKICFSWNGDLFEHAVLPEIYEVGTTREWEQGVLNHVRIKETIIKANKGTNALRFFAKYPGIVLEKIILQEEGSTLPESYLGPNNEWSL